MRKTIISLAIILISLSCFSQQKVDSVKQAAINKKVIEIEAKTSIQEFKVWLFKNYLTAEKFQEFFSYYNAFIDHKYSTVPQTDSVINKPKK